MKSSITRALGIALALTLMHAPASAETVLKFASFVPAKYVLHEPIFQKLADDIDRETNEWVGYSGVGAGGGAGRRAR